MFVDASAIVAILTDEDDAETLSRHIEETEERYTSPVAIFETVAALIRKKGDAPEAALETMKFFLDAASIKVIPISEGIGHAAILAYGAYGKGQNHPAQLNMGDCFAYACAKAHHLTLLYKGNDFAHTDIA